MTKDEHLSFVLRSINERMHPGRSCPGAASLGEFAAISTMHGHHGSEFYVASLYLWPAAMDLQAATVAAWFTAAFCKNVVVSAILHDPDNDTIDGVTDGGRCWPWEVSFSLEGPHDADGAPASPGAQQQAPSGTLPKDGLGMEVPQFETDADEIAWLRAEVARLKNAPGVLGASNDQPKGGA